MIMNYRSELERLGFEVNKTFTAKATKITHVSFSVKKKGGKAASFKTLKEAYELRDLM